MLNVHLNFSIAFFESNHFLLKTLMFLQLLRYHQLPITITLFKFKEAKQTSEIKTLRNLSNVRFIMHQSVPPLQI